MLESPAVAEDAAASVCACWLSAGGCHPAAGLMTQAACLRFASCELSIKMCWHQGCSRRTRAAQGCAWPCVRPCSFISVLGKVKIWAWKYFVVGRQKSPRALGHTDLGRGLQKMVCRKWSAMLSAVNSYGSQACCPSAKAEVLFQVYVLWQFGLKIDTFSVTCNIQFD